MSALLQRMLDLSAGSKTQLTIWPAGPNGIQKLLPANPNRLYVEFRRGPTAAAMRDVIPGPVPDGYVGHTSPIEPIAYKFADAPSFVAGEWYGDQVAGFDWLILECVLVPGV